MKSVMRVIYMVILIFVCTLLEKGFGAAFEFMGRLITFLIEFIKCICHLVMKFPDLFGITDWLWARGIFIFVAIVSGAFGYAFTRSEKKKVLGVISSIVSLISTVILFS